jgi:uncharacterized protein YjbJ (UPF0337 family)
MAPLDRDGPGNAVYVSFTASPITTGETRMNWDQVEGNWKQYKGQIMSKWGKLTDDDIESINGKRTELLGLIQTRYGRDKEQAEVEVDHWIKHIN